MHGAIREADRYERRSAQRRPRLIVIINMSVRGVAGGVGRCSRCGGRGLLR